MSHFIEAAETLTDSTTLARRADSPEAPFANGSAVPGYSRNGSSLPSASIAESDLIVPRILERIGGLRVYNRRLLAALGVSVAIHGALVFGYIAMTGGD